MAFFEEGKSYLHAAGTFEVKHILDYYGLQLYAAGVWHSSVMEYTTIRVYKQAEFSLFQEITS